MNEAVAARLVEIRAQLEEGERALASLDAQREQLVANLLRLSGAAQVLGELVAELDAEPVDGPPLRRAGVPAA